MDSRRACQRSEALQFLSDWGRESGRDVRGRRSAVDAELVTTGSYRHTDDELLYGCRVAWRNAVRCIGRGYWRLLNVIDARAAGTSKEVFEACVQHLRSATNGGKVQLLITVFPARRPATAGFRIWNAQLIRYAGHRMPDGSIVGDPETVELTDFVEQHGWRGTGGRFDVLPLVVEDPGGRIEWFDLPQDAVLEVPITHPTVGEFDQLGLRWYAHPAISNQSLRIGGVTYPAAPFSGWYTATEVAARNLSDRGRYNALPAVAEMLGLDTRSDRTLWKERALIELMAAVLYSYDQCGVTMVDHHFADASFVRHEERERREGRDVPGRWRSLVSPSAPATTSVFHRDYEDAIRLPNFFPQPLGLTDLIVARRDR